MYNPKLAPQCRRPGQSTEGAPATDLGLWQAEGGQDSPPLPAPAAQPPQPPPPRPPPDLQRHSGAQRAGPVPPTPQPPHPRPRTPQSRTPAPSGRARPAPPPQSAVLVLVLVLGLPSGGGPARPSAPRGAPRARTRCPPPVRGGGPGPLRARWEAPRAWVPGRGPSALNGAAGAGLRGACQAGAGS